MTASRLVPSAFVALALLGLFGPGLASAGEKERLKQVLTDLSYRLDTLQRDPWLAPSAEKAKLRVKWFQGKLGPWFPSTLEQGRPLRQGLEADLRALQELPADSQAAALVVAEVEADLAVKNEHCKQAGLAALVTAKVRTLRDGREVQGLEVFYIPKVLERTPPSSPPRFPTLSAAEEQLAPGRYVLWAGADTAGRTTVVVGNGGRETRIELLVR